jgi:hypothetical protein
VRDRGHDSRGVLLSCPLDPVVEAVLVDPKPRCNLGRGVTLFQDLIDRLSLLLVRTPAAH